MRPLFSEDPSPNPCPPTYVTWTRAARGNEVMKFFEKTWGRIRPFLEFALQILVCTIAHRSDLSNIFSLLNHNFSRNWHSWNFRCLNVVDFSCLSTTFRQYFLVDSTLYSLPWTLCIKFEKINKRTLWGKSV